MQPVADSSDTPGFNTSKIKDQNAISATLPSRISQDASSWQPDLLFISQVFFNSGLALGEEEFNAIANAIGDKPLMVVDGYHGFCALPTDLGTLHKQIFYLAGGYKYAQAGEGVCFPSIPPGCRLRPRNTGWFAQANPADNCSPVRYRNDGDRFAGATIDAYIKRLQARFLEHLDGYDGHRLNRHSLLLTPEREHGHFFTFRLHAPRQEDAMAQALLRRGVRVDVRGARLRFGFGMYHTPENIDELFNRLDGSPF